MYEEEIHFRKLLPKQSETVLTPLTLVTVTFGPSDMFRIPSFVRCVNVKNILNYVDFIFGKRTLLIKKSTLYVLCKAIPQI